MHLKQEDSLFNDEMFPETNDLPELPASLKDVGFLQENEPVALVRDCRVLSSYYC